MKMYELLATPDKWCQRAFAKDCFGVGCPSASEEAMSWCLLGAANKCYPNLFFTTSRILEHRLGRKADMWNDAPERTHAEVLALCKELDI